MIASLDDGERNSTVPKIVALFSVSSVCLGKDLRGPSSHTHRHTHTQTDTHSELIDKRQHRRRCNSFSFLFFSFFLFSLKEGDPDANTNTHTLDRNGLAMTDSCVDLYVFFFLLISFYYTPTHEYQFGPQIFGLLAHFFAVRLIILTVGNTIGSFDKVASM